jgi:hypothetical protein
LESAFGFGSIEGWTAGGCIKQCRAVLYFDKREKAVIIIALSKFPDEPLNTMKEN